jgi:hypothetical protein
MDVSMDCSSWRRWSVRWTARRDDFVVGGWREKGRRDDQFEDHGRAVQVRREV